MSGFNVPLASATDGHQYGSGFKDVVIFKNQGNPATATVTATLTAAQVTAGILTVNQGAGAAVALTLPSGTAMDAAVPAMYLDTAFELTIVNTSTIAAEDLTLVAGSGFSYVGNTAVPSFDAVSSISSATLILRRVAVATWIAYRK